MRIYHGIEALPRFRHAVVTVGSFDGVHRGHQAMVARLVEEARRLGGESVVVTFDPHPRVALGRAEGMRLLTTPEEKARLLERMGVDNLVVLPFDRAFSALSGEEFARRYLVDAFGAEVLVAGYDHRFGHDRMHGEQLERLGLLRVVTVGEELAEGRHVSSTAVRRLLDEGRTREAEELLGHAAKGE